MARTKQGSRGSRSRSSSRQSSEEEKALPPPSEPTALQREDSDPPMPPWSLVRSGSSWFSGLSGSMHPSSSANDLREMGGRLRTVRSRGNLRNADDAEAPRTFVKTVRPPFLGFGREERERIIWQMCSLFQDIYVASASICVNYEITYRVEAHSSHVGCESMFEYTISE